MSQPNMLTNNIYIENLGQENSREREGREKEIERSYNDTFTYQPTI